MHAVGQMRRGDVIHQAVCRIGHPHRVRTFLFGHRDMDGGKEGPVVFLTALFGRTKTDPAVVLHFGRSVQDGRHIPEVNRTISGKIDHRVAQIGRIADECAGIDDKLPILLLEAAAPRLHVADLQRASDLQRRCLSRSESLRIQFDANASWPAAHDGHAIGVRDGLQIVLKLLG